VRGRWIRVFTATTVAAVLCTTIGVSGSASAVTTGGSDATATCTFNGVAFALIQGVKLGKKIDISCTGLPALHPYLVVEVSLLAAVDPQAAAALSGDIASPSGVLGAIAAVPEINLHSAAFPVSDTSGNLTEDWTVPTAQATDPNATCPPSRQQYNSGLLGCAIAMIDLTSGGDVGAGSALMEFKGFPELPPEPALSLSTATATAGQAVSVGGVTYKKVNKDTYWWLPTLEALDALLGGAGPTPVINVTVGGVTVDSSGITITTASYNGTTFTPPAISGSFTVPPGVTGSQLVAITINTSILGLPLGNSALAPIDISG
jgi:hypothetical protein